MTLPPDPLAGASRRSQRALDAAALEPMAHECVQQLTPLVEGLLDAAWLVEPGSLRLLAANAAAERLFGVAAAALCQTDALALAATAEDVAFWEQAGAEVSEPVESQTLISRPDGQLVCVHRRVSLVYPGPDARQAVYLVVLRDRSEEMRTQAGLEERLSELRATLDSTTDGILVSGCCAGLPIP